ncbi:unnamed protein product, partial [marine sediment metagenome]
MKYPEDFINKLICADCQEGMRYIPNGSIDLIVTDPPYGYAFMQKNWDKALVSVKTWEECLRVLKPGAFAFIMCAPRQDVLSRQIINLEEAGFITGFTSLYFTYASGFPKAQNISKAIDKKECRKQLTEKLGRRPTKEEFKKKWENYRKITGYKKNIGHIERGDSNLDDQIRKEYGNPFIVDKSKEHIATSRSPFTLEAKLLSGSYGGFQPKPAVEVILVVMKPLSEKTYVDQALKNSKGITWLEKGRLPYKGQNDVNRARGRKGDYEKMNIPSGQKYLESLPVYYKNEINNRGRFPANLLVSDDVLNDGKVFKNSFRPSNKRAGKIIKAQSTAFNDGLIREGDTLGYPDSGSFSRYFDLDKWWEEKIKQLSESAQKTFPFLIVPKASKNEKNKGCKRLEKKARANINKMMGEAGNFKTGSGNVRTVKFKNHHPTVKPIKLMSYLIILGSR